MRRPSWVISVGPTLPREERRTDTQDSERPCDHRHGMGRCGHSPGMLKATSSWVSDRTLPRIVRGSSALGHPDLGFSATNCGGVSAVSASSLGPLVAAPWDLGGHPRTPGALGSSSSEMKGHRAGDIWAAQRMAHLTLLQEN